MNLSLLKEVVATCRRRIEQGDCSTERPFSVEQLEEAVVALADRVTDMADAVIALTDEAEKNEWNRG